MLPLCSICAAYSVPSLLFNTVFLLFWAWLLACHTAKALGKDPANTEAGTQLLPVSFTEAFVPAYAHLPIIAATRTLAAGEAWEKRHSSFLPLNC